MAEAAPRQRRERRRDGKRPEWESARPLEAYPTLRSRRLPELSVPPILVAVVALALAAAVLFALPGLLGFGGPSAATAATPTMPVATELITPAPTPVPQPTDQIYVVKSGDTMSSIAGRFGIPLEELIAANAETLPNPDKLQIGDELVIPAPQPRRAAGGERDPGRELSKGSGGYRRPASARREVDQVIFPASTRNEASRCWLGAPGRTRQDVGLVGDPEVHDAAGDHLQPRLGAEEPAADLLDAAQRPGVVADVDPHLDALVHERDRALAIALVELLEELFHRVDCTHGSNASRARRASPAGVRGSASHRARR